MNGVSCTDGTEGSIKRSSRNPGDRAEAEVANPPERATKKDSRLEIDPLGSFVAEDFVAVAQQLPRDLLKRKRLPQLLRGPLRGRMSRYVKVHHPTPLMRQHQKHVQHLEASRRHGEEIDRHRLLKFMYSRI